MGYFQLTKGDICIAQFHPSIGRGLKRFRPTLVCTNPDKNLDSRFVTLLPLSTKPSNKQMVEVELLSNSYKFLDRASYVLCWYPITLDSSRIVEKIGSISEDDYSKVEGALKDVFEL